MKRFVGLGIALVAVIAAVLAGVTLTGGSSTSTASAAAPPQQIGMKVLLITSSTDTTTGDGAAFADWENTLNREGVPYNTVVTSSQGLPALSSTSGGADVANYQGVIVAGSGTEGLTTAEWTTLQTFEQEFSVRQVTADAVPSADYGLQTPANGGDSLLAPSTSLALTADGKTVFPYLKAVSFDPTYSTYGAESAPLANPSGTVDTLISGPSGSSMLGIYTTSDGRQTMYQTFNMGPGYLQSELLRHGELAWLSRGTYFGYQRNYLETDIDDNFLSDDTWDTTTHSTDYDSTAALRESASDVADAANWETTNGYDDSFRIDMLFNGGGSTEYSDDNAGATDPLIAAFKANKGSFGFINHTWDHPNLDQGCANAAYIESEVSENTAWGVSTLGLTSSTSSTASPLGTENPGAVVTGEHSGLANLIPGNPGTVDPPEFDAVTPVAGTTTLPAGSYTYAITDDFTPGGGASSASESTVTLAAGDSVAISWDAVCHAADYYVYRLNPGATSWVLVDQMTAPSDQFGSTGPETFNISDTGAGTATTTAPSTTANAAVETPYEQNTVLDAAFKELGITDFGSDASKPYPNPATDTFATGTALASIPQVSAGSTFTEPTSGAEAIPRYPTNIYYNASTEAQEVDEFNTLYYAPSGTGCLAVTDCQTTEWTWSQILDDVTGIGGPYVGMFQHLMGNDPRPDYFHQTNMMGTPPASGISNSPSVGDGLYYSVMDQLLANYDSYFDTSGDAGSAPIEQPTMAEIGTLLDEQNAWNDGNVSGVSGSIEGNTVSVTDTGAVDVPLSGTTDGQPYAGDTSEWVPKFTGTKTFTANTAWPAPPTTGVVVTIPTGPAPTLGGGTTPKPSPGTSTGTTPPAKKIVKKTAIYYHAVQVAPKTVKIKKGKVTVSLKCVASRGKTAKGKVCEGTFTLTVAGRKVKHAFKIKSTKVDRIAVKLPKVAQTATRKSKHHRITGTLSISSKQSHAKARVARGKLTIQR